MANTNPYQQVLSEFVQNLVDDLKNGRITPDAALVASQQYPYLRAFVTQHGDEIADALQDEGVFRATLVNLLSAAGALVAGELPQFQIEKPDAPLSPNDVVARARAFRRARTEVFASVRERRWFVHRIVQNWIAKTGTGGALQQEMERALSDSISPAETAERIGRVLSVRRPGAAPAVQELSAATQRLAGVAALPKELVARVFMPRLDRFAAIAIQVISSTTLSPSVVPARALSVAQAADALSATLAKEGGVAAAGVFFRAFASRPAQKAFAAAADALLAQLTPLARQEVIKATFSRSLEGVLVKTEALTEALGRDFVESELFRVAVESARKELAPAASGGGGVKRARGALKDVIGLLLRGPAVVPLVGSPREAILSYFTLLAVEAKLPHNEKILFPDHAPVVTALGQLTQGQPEHGHATAVAAAGFASPEAFRVAVSRLVPLLPSWEALRLLLLSSFESTGGGFVEGAGRAGRSVVAAPGAGLGWVTGGLGRLGLGFFGFFGWFGNGFVNMVFGGGLGALFHRSRGRPQPEGFFDDMPKLIAVAVVVVIVVLFVFPSFFNSPLTSRAAKYAALLVNSQPQNQPEEFQDFDQTYPPPDYIDFSDLASKEFNCLSYGGGIPTGAGTSVPLEKAGGETGRIEGVINTYPQLKLLSCGLGCPARKVNITKFTAPSPYGGFAPSARPGNIILYQHVFTRYGDQTLAFLLAHELAHQLDWFNSPVAAGFASLGCGDAPPSTYRYAGNSAEAFAESVALYLINHPEIQSYCGGRALSYFSGALGQCR